MRAGDLLWVGKNLRLLSCVIARLEVRVAESIVIIKIKRVSLNHFNIHREYKAHSTISRVF
jgi:hypothetical protein